jgi:hypothetical protein
MLIFGCIWTLSLASNTAGGKSEQVKYERSTSPRPSPHFAPPTPQNAEREKVLAYGDHPSVLTNHAVHNLFASNQGQCRDRFALFGH